MRDCDIYDKNGRYCAKIRDNVIYDETGLFGSYKGKIVGNDIYDENGLHWGVIKDNGEVMKGSGFFGEYVGKIKNDGSIHVVGEGYGGKVVDRDRSRGSRSSSYSGGGGGGGVSNDSSGYSGGAPVGDGLLGLLAGACIVIFIVYLLVKYTPDYLVSAFTEVDIAFFFITIPLVVQSVVLFIALLMGKFKKCKDFPEVLKSMYAVSIAVYLIVVVITGVIDELILDDDKSIWIFLVGVPIVAIKYSLGYLLPSLGVILLLACFVDTGGNKNKK